MLCEFCKLTKIGPKTPPFGYFFCDADHMQCFACNNKYRGLCYVCRKQTEFVSMSIKPANVFKYTPSLDLPYKCTTEIHPYFSPKFLSEINRLPQLADEAINLTDSRSTVFKSIAPPPNKLTLQLWVENGMINVNRIKNQLESKKNSSKINLLEQHKADIRKIKRNIQKIALQCQQKDL